MAYLKIRFLWVAYILHFLIPPIIKAQYLQDEEPVFGFGAEDDENNILQTLLRDEYNIINADEINAIKASRQDQEDVEVLLNPGPMIAPNIVVKNFVDARLTIGTTDDILKKQGRYMQNSVTKDPLRAAFDDKLDFILNKMSLQQNELFGTNFSLQNPYNIKELLTPEKPCQMKYHSRNGSFGLNFHQDCTVMIAAPDIGSRIMLTCSPIVLGDCKTHKDSLTLNLVGDLKFEKNSYFYCGRDSSIRAISVRNKMAIRVKKTDEVFGSTQCSFHTRKFREIDPSKSTTSCGQLGRGAKIVGGRRVPPGLFPWVAQLDITRTDGSQTGCTGSIVSPHYILTAAHCMKRAESISAFMGGTDRQEILGSEVLIQAEKYILHKKWSAKTLLADIALLKLTEPIQYTEDISPICLPEGKMLTEDFAGRRAVAVGWGRTDSRKKAPRKLYRVKLPFLSDASCRKIYRRFYLPKVMMCTDSKTDSAICYGMT